MALPYAQTKKFFFGQGVETRTEQEAIPLGTLHLLQNARLDKAGVIQKKYGSAALPDTVLIPTGDVHSPAVVPDIKRLTTLGETLIGIGPNGYPTNLSAPCNDIMFKNSPTENKWIASGSRSGCECCIARLFPVGNVSGVFPYGMFATDVAASGKYLCTATANTDGTNFTITISVIDTDIDRAIYQTTATGTNGAVHPRVITFNSKFYIFSKELTGNNLQVTEINPTTLAVTVNTAVTDSYFNTSEDVFFDAGVNGSSAYLAYRDSGGTTTIKQFSSLNPVTVANTVTTANVPARHLSIFFSGTNVCLAICRAADFRLGSWTSTLTLLTAPFVAYNAQTEMGYGSDLTLSSLNLVVISEGTTYGNRNVRSATWDPTTGALTSNFAAVGLGGFYQIGSRPFNYFSRWHLYITYRNDSDQDTMFLVHLERLSGSGPSAYIPVAKALYGEVRPPPNLSVGVTPSQIATSVVAVNSSTTRFVASFVRNDGTWADGSFTTNHSNHIMEVEFNDVRRYYDREAQGNLLFAGGLLGQYDGYEWVENGFLTAPEPPVLTQSAGGSLTALGVYQYVLMYEWTDAAGNIHRSAPSIPATITLTGGNQTVGVVIPGDLLTRKGNVNVRLFRTEASGTIFYSLSQAPVTDTSADSTIIDNEILYTTGNVLENDSMYLVYGMTIFKDRVWLLTDRGLYYSKRMVKGRPVEFSEAFFTNVEDSGGKVTGIATLGDKLLIFKKDKIYFTAGDGPEDTGSGGLFSNPEIIPGDCGCISQTSIAELPSSVMFQARDFIWQMDAGLNLSPVGARVSYFLGETAVINKTLVLERQREIKFMMDSRILNYNSLTDQWSVDPTYGGPSLTLWRTNLIRSDSSFNVYQQDSSSWKDGSDFVELRASTGWINLEEILGFQRCWLALIHARFYNNHTLNIKVYYDYLPKVVDSYTFTASSATLAAFTDANLYTASPYAGSGIPYTFRMKLKKQKCTAIKFEFYDSSQSSDGHSLDLVALSLKLGLKRPDFKIPAAQSI